MKKSLFIIFIISGLLLSNFAIAQEKTEINFFYSKICPHCTKEKEFLQDLQHKYPKIGINSYEITSSPENRQILQEFFNEYEVPENQRKWVPVTFTTNEYFIGFNQEIAKNIEKCLKACLNQEELVPLKIKIPILGNLDVDQMSLPALAVTLGALDGFNPCAMWVLLFLIALLINTHSKKRMLLRRKIFN